MYCNKCGSQVREDIQFCPICGQAMIQNSGVNSNDDKRPYFEVMPEYNKKENKFPVKGVIAIILVVVLIIVVFTFMMLKPGIQKIKGLSVYKDSMYIQEKDKNYTIKYTKIGTSIIEAVAVGSGDASDFIDYMEEVLEKDGFSCSMADEEEFNNKTWYYIKCEDSYETDYIYATNNKGKLYAIIFASGNNELTVLEKLRKKVTDKLEFYE